MKVRHINIKYRDNLDWCRARCVEVHTTKEAASKCLGELNSALPYGIWIEENLEQLEETN